MMARMESKALRDILKLYFIFGSRNCLKNPLEVLQEAVAGGITMFQFREKGQGAFTGAEKVQFAKKLQEICRKNKIPFIVDDDIDLALELDADGVHIGQEDDPVHEVRKRIGDKILGVSAYTMEEVEKAIKDGADYLGIGPVFPTSTKEDAKAVQGTALMKEVRKKGIDIPIVGIGGIKVNNAQEVIEAGADGISVITAITYAGNITETTRDLRKQVSK